MHKTTFVLLYTYHAAKQRFYPPLLVEGEVEAEILGLGSPPVRLKYD